MHFTGHRGSIRGAAKLLVIARSSLIVAGASLSGWTQTCTSPTSLDARLHAHPNADTYAAIGTWFSENHKADCAVEAFQSGLKLEPDSARLSYLLGLSLCAAGRMQEAVTPLHQSIQLDPGEEQTHLLLGTALASLGRDKEALPEWEATLKLDPSSKKALDGLARSLLSIGDYGTVINRLRSASRDQNLTLDLASAYRKADMFDEATQTLTKGLKTYPNSDALTGALVSLDIHLSHFEAAQTLAEKLARMKPRDIEAQRIYLQTLVSHGDNRVAAPLGRRLLAIAPHDSDFLYLNGILEREAGDFATARKHLEESVAINPNFYNSHYNLGVALAALQDAAGAKEQFTRAIELGAAEPEVHFELAKVLRILGETEEAQEQLKVYQQRLKEEANQSLAILKSTQAEEAVKAGDNQKAADLFREASAALPDNPALAYRLALVLHALGDIAGERAALEHSIKADPEFALAQYQLGYLESREGNLAGADEQFRLAVKAAPNFVQAWVALAASLAMESRLREANDALGNALKLEPENPSALGLRDKLAAQGPR
jgi:tetratricopeptide (TPR) repeat protein